MADASEVFGDWVQALLDEQDSRKASIEDRALNVIKNAAALVGLLFALTAFITDADDFTLPSLAQVTLAVALVFLVASGAWAIVANSPRTDYRNADGDELEALMITKWDIGDDHARRMVIRTQLEAFTAAQKANGKKAEDLLVAIKLELIGVAFVALAAITIAVDVG